ncbi:MAG: hypothetical protein KatS3mg068_1142 [Candidatus Sericytochromatia bacterium]|nr:MAG: hypothetical protein KatS3mg068_1142 [Candidatus Sericytochromatia bacterium]
MTQVGSTRYVQQAQTQKPVQQAQTQKPVQQAQTQKPVQQAQTQKPVQQAQTQKPVQQAPKDTSQVKTQQCNIKGQEVKDPGQVKFNQHENGTVKTVCKYATKAVKVAEVTEKVVDKAAKVVSVAKPVAHAIHHSPIPGVLSKTAAVLTPVSAALDLADTIHYGKKASEAKTQSEKNKYAVKATISAISFGVSATAAMTVGACALAGVGMAVAAPVVGAAAVVGLVGWGAKAAIDYFWK